MAVAEKVMPVAKTAAREDAPRRVHDAVMLDLAFRIRSMFGEKIVSRYDAESLAEALLATVGQTGQTSAERLLAHLRAGRSKDAAERLTRLLFPDLPA